MSEKRRQSRSTRQSRNKNRNRLVYAVAILTLTALVGVAFFSPGWVFDFQDSRQCRDMELEVRENVDVAVLSTNYESSFYRRMVNFAENQTENTNYYVASEELTDHQRLHEFLNSENGLNRNSIVALLETQLITSHIYDCEISKWKQYVIYSDDYAKGVNFILWYIELEHPDESIGTYKLLLEADTGEFYGLQADTGGTAFMRYDVEYYDKSSVREKYSLEDYLGFTSMSADSDAWITLAYIYSGLMESDFFEYYSLLYGAMEGIYGETYVENANDAGGVSLTYSTIEEELKAKMGIVDENSQWMDFLLTNPTMFVWDEGNRLECTFPYGEGSLIYRMQIDESISYPWTLHNVTVGFPAIYSLIPEFE
ncbi:MAG: hypothetical protein K2P59_12410 [Acetatifactor sp.]|nr:hypothetical protein [Acetatifactor sp.]